MLTLLWLTFIAPLLLSTASTSPSNWRKRNKETVQNIYDLTIYPANAKIINEGSSAVPAGLFNENATGRVTPVGEFFGFQDSIEYFFGLAPLPTGSPPNGAITNATLVDFTSGCAEVAASTVWLTVRTINDDGSAGAYISTLKQVAFWHFDAEGAVLQYDAWIPSLDLYANLANPSANETVRIQQLCGLQAQTCVGDNMVYDSVNACVEILTAKPFGRLDEAWGDNVVCRTIHVLLTKFRPEVHCPHVGPTGGGKCIDVAYNDVYFNDEFVFGEPLGQPFNCKN